MVELKNRKIFGIEYFNPELNENMLYFPAADVFVNEPNYVDKYRLVAKYRDYKYVTKGNLPKDFPINNVEYNSEGLCELISIRACHRILYADISKNRYHFLDNQYLREKLTEYDKYHGGFFTYLFERKPYPKNNMYLNVSVLGTAYVTHVDYFEMVKGLDNGTGLLIYAHDDYEGMNNYTIYLDAETSPGFNFTYKSINKAV